MAGRARRGVFVLVKTSNPGGRMLQDLLADGRPLYRHVAQYVERLAAATAGECGYGAVGAVVGATYPAQLAELRGGDAAHLVPRARLRQPRRHGRRRGGGLRCPRARGAIVNNSRGIIFAHSLPAYERFGPQRWQEAVEAATKEMIRELA